MYTKKNCLKKSRHFFFLKTTKSRKYFFRFLVSMSSPCSRKTMETDLPHIVGVICSIMTGATFAHKSAIPIFKRMCEYCVHETAFVLGLGVLGTACLGCVAGYAAGHVLARAVLACYPELKPRSTRWLPDQTPKETIGLIFFGTLNVLFYSTPLLFTTKKR